MQKDDPENKKIHVGHARVGLFAGHKSQHESCTYGFHGYCAVLRVKNRLGNDGFKDQLVTLMKGLVDVSEENDVHVMDGVSFLIEGIEATGVTAMDEMFNMAVLAGLITMGKGYCP